MTPTLARRGLLAGLLPLLLSLGCPQPTDPTPPPGTPTSGLVVDPTDTPTASATATASPSGTSTPGPVATPTAPDGDTPTSPDGDTPTSPDGDTPTSPDGGTPTLPGNATPTLPGNATPTLPGNSTPTAPDGDTPTFPPEPTPPLNTPTATPDRDLDDDGAPAPADCDDGDPDVWPGAEEVCDVKDNDCDGGTDEGALLTFYRDIDKDGHGDPLVTTTGCAPPRGYVEDGDDCDDRQASVYPGAAEACDGRDNDCDGVADEEVASQWYLDADGDQYGAGAAVEACKPPTAVYVATSGDCDDTRDDVHPEAAETCDDQDEDCDGEVDEDATDPSIYYADPDSDTWGSGEPIEACDAPAKSATRAGDCGPTDPTVYPGAQETCGGIDEDCDTRVDEGASGAPTWYLDADEDTFGRASGAVTACYPPSDTYVRQAGDCADLDATVYPAAPEQCDGVDDDCDTKVDEAAPGADLSQISTWYLDADKDTWGRDEGPVKACSAPSTNYAGRGGDCDDLDAAEHPGAAELCDASDDDCDGATDEGVKTTFYADADVDGHGSPSSATQACAAPTGYVSSSDDCADTDPNIYTGAPERCNGLDDNCNGAVPANESDGDGDGARRCGGDCDDTDGTVAPGKPELCDGKDNDCNSALPANESDADGDGYLQCVNDCDDSHNTVYPGAIEVCDHLDNDCDGVKDDVSGDDCHLFDGTFGTTWVGPLAGVPDFSGNLSTYQPLDYPWLYNFYGTRAGRYDADTNLWGTTAGTMPYYSAWSTAAPWDGRMWMLRNASIYYMDIDTEQWTTVRSLKSGDDYNMTESDDAGYIYGYLGTGEMVIYDAIDDVVTYVNTGKGSQYETRLGWDPETNSIYFGGFAQGNIYRFHLDTLETTLQTTHPEGFLNDIFCSDRSGHLYAAGSSGGQTLWQYDIQANAWKRLPDYPVDHGNNGSCTVSETGWLFMTTGGAELYKLELY